MPSVTTPLTEFDPVRWHPADIAEAVCDGLQKRAAQEEAEQAVYGFDALPELGLHPLIHQALAAAGWGVFPEQRYPSDRQQSKKSHGQRCDAVLTPSPSLPLRDPDITGTLFENGPAIDPENAYWLEIKSVAQFETTGPFRRYAAEMLSPVTRDITKIWNDGHIRHGGLLLLLFTVDQATAQHDVLAWHRRCLDKGHPVGPPVLRGLAINDRIGNAWCQIAVFTVRGM